MPSKTPWNAFIILDEVLASFGESGGGGPSGAAMRVHWGRLDNQRAHRPGGGDSVFTAVAGATRKRKKR